MLLRDKVALITGGTRGIGYAIVKCFIAQGAKVAFTYISAQDKAEKMVEECKKEGGEVICIRSDASSFNDSERVVNEVIQHFGKIDILVNNAGITRDNLILRMSEQQFDEVISANLKSAFNFIKHTSKIMLRQKSGSIINLTSIVGEKGQAGQANYAASKAGIIGLTKSIADEFGSRNIRCNAIAPGFIETDMTDALNEETKKSILNRIPMQRMGKADEVADTALFLASDLSAYVSGQVLSVCGGMNR